MPILGTKITSRERSILKDNFDISKIYVGEIMDTRSPTNNGEIKVWLLNTDTDRNKSENWLVAQYCPNFYGTTFFKSGNFDYNKTPTAFGMWSPIPYVGNYVFVFFAVLNGGKTRPYWFGCPMDNYMNETIPGLSKDLSGKTDLPSICEKNYKVEGVTLDGGKGIVGYEPLVSSLKTQGLTEDLLRGPSTSSARRETPSMVYGMSTPLGNQFVIDDGWSLDDNKTTWNDSNKDVDRLLFKNNLPHDKQPWSSTLEITDKTASEGKFKRFNGGFRFRTRHGTQLLVLDSGQIYIINKDGSAWTEWTDDGHIDVYSEKGVNVSTGGDLNLKSKGNINIESDKNIQIKSKGRIVEQSASTVDMITGTANIIGNLYTDSIETPNGIIDNLISTQAQATGIFKGSLLGTASYASTSGMEYSEMPTPAQDMSSRPDVQQITVNSIKGQNKGLQSTITTRAPTHEPYDGHDKNDCIPDIVTVNKNIETQKTKISNTVK